MKVWVIVGIVAGLFLLAGILLAGNISANNDDTGVKGNIDCSTCGGGCTQQSNCGLSTCGAVSGTGSCGCGRG